MYAKSRRKKLWIPVTAVLLVAALAAGIWFGTRSGGEPVNVYPFQYIGMTEFWGDAQESYGPVSTDKIQTEFLSSTQTVTEVKVKDGDTVKKGDVLFSFDTTLDALTLERKRLEVEKIKVQIKVAGERLQDTREMVPYEPPKPTEPKEEELGDELKDTYKISDRIGKNKEIYDGKTKESAVICWLKEGNSITDAILNVLFHTAKDYQNASVQDPEVDLGQDPESSASDKPEDETQSNSTEVSEPEKDVKEIPVLLRFSGMGQAEKGMDTLNKTTKVGEKIVDAYTHNGKTYWLKSAKIKGQAEPLQDLFVPVYPQEAGEERDTWEATWGQGVEVEYVRSVSFTAQQLKDGALVDFPEGNALSLEHGQDVLLKISSIIHDLSKEYDVKYTISPQDGFFSEVQEGNTYYLTVRPETVTTRPVTYTVTAKYEFKDNFEQTRAVDETFSFNVSVVSQPQNKVGEFYVVFKTTQDNYLKGMPTLWQGAKVTAYDNGTFDMQLYNPYEVEGFFDHTIEQEEEIEIDLPVIDPDQMYTAEQILDMQKQCYAIIKEQNEKLKLAETEYNVMQRELGDGNIYAEIDGKVVSLLTEEEARQQKQPLIKVSGGGGFYIEGSVSELEKEKLKIGQEVNVNDWSSGGMYTGEVVSIGDFPLDNDNWNGMGNPTASYYPFKAFVGEDADLQAGSYVSMSYSTASAEQGIYLEKAFVRTEKGNSYIFVRGTDGRLEKRNVKVGKVLWGSYYEILSPLGEEDCLAFPYGKNVKAGAPTVESDLSTLYSY